MERVVWRQSKAQRSIRTVDTAGLAGTKSAGSRCAGRRTEVVGHGSVTEARIHIDDRCNRPVVQDCLAGVAETLEVCVVNNAGYELVPAIERRQTAISRRI